MRSGPNSWVQGVGATVFVAQLSFELCWGMALTNGFGICARYAVTLVQVIAFMRIIVVWNMPASSAGNKLSAVQQDAQDPFFEA